jgi:hypothetical protein
VLAAAAISTGAAQAAAADPEQPFAPVVHEVLAGDLVMAGNSNLLSAGGFSSPVDAAADVDGDTTPLCVGRLYVPATCGENSSSAILDIPMGARVVAARLYVNTTLMSGTGPVQVRLDGPAAGYDYTTLSSSTPGVAKVREDVGRASRAALPMRQAVWDVTDYVAAAGAGSYTVADIVFERAGAYTPYAAWTIVVAYELDAAADLSSMSPEQQARFALRAVSWDDGFATLTDAAVDVVVDGFAVPAGAGVFAKTFHLAANPRPRSVESLLFAGQPVGNNGSPGDRPAPLGVHLGADPACNSTTDIVNDSICVLGTPVATKVPGAADFVSARDGRTPSSASAVDFDVIRIPDRYFVAGATSATLSLRSAGSNPLAVGMLAASVDLPVLGAESIP